MNTCLLKCGAALLALTPFALHAQTLTANPGSGFATTKLFEVAPGRNVGSIAADGAGTIYYLEQDAYPQTRPSILYSRSLADGYSSPTLVRDFGEAFYSSFMLLEGGTLYLGENSTGRLFALGTSGAQLDLLGTLAYNYDAAFSAGSLFVSASPVFEKNQVFRFTLGSDGSGGLQLSAPDLILDTVNDYSGPLAFDGTGALLYGASKQSINGIFRYTAAEIAGVLDVPPIAPNGDRSLTLDGSHRAVSNGSNGAFAMREDGALWQDASFGGLTLIDVASGTFSDIASTQGSPIGTEISENLGDLFVAGDTLFAAVTDYGTRNRSAVYSIQAVPEPATVGLLAGGVVLLAGLRGRDRRTSQDLNIR